MQDKLTRLAAIRLDVGLNADWSVSAYKLDDRRFYPLFFYVDGAWWPVDLFVVRPPAQWGAIFAIRTGPADYARGTRRLPARAPGVQRIGMWRMGTAGPSVYAALAAIPTTEPTTPAPDEITAALDGVWDQTLQLAALEHADRAVAIQTHVRRLKVALGRES